MGTGIFTGGRLTRVRQSPRSPPLLQLCPRWHAVTMRVTMQLRALSLKPASSLSSVASRSAPLLSARTARAGRQLRVSAPISTRETISTEVEAKYKLKTRKAAAKRYKITGSGKVMTRKPGKQHLNEKYSRNQKKALSRENALSRSVVKRNVIGAMPYAKIDKSKTPKCMEREVNKRAAKVAPQWTPAPAEE